VDGVPLDMADLLGTLTNAPSTIGPLTGQPCLLWQVTLFQRVEGDEQAGPTWDPVWTHGRSDDIVVAYEMRKDGADKPLTWSGTVSVPGRNVRWSGDREAVPGGVLLSPDPVVFPKIKLPDDWAQQLLSRPDDFRFIETRLSTGDVIRLQQGPLPATGRRPDPEQPFRIVPTSQEETFVMALGCLIPILGMAAVTSAVLGWVVLP
jgi:hypothetical protein